MSVLPLLISQGTKPLDRWKVTSRNGSVSRVFDTDIKANAIELIGSNISTTSLTLPYDDGQSLALPHTTLLLQIKPLNDAPFSLNLEVTDATDVRRRIRFGTHIPKTRISNGTCSVPLNMQSDWSDVVLDLRSVCYAAYGIPYKELRRVTLQANCRVRVVAAVNEGQELPPTLRLPRRTLV
ncbi:MAG: uncharacterized protein KVP18_004379 [Porospora cf. gigantea A]|uniref:uncharacterized protein n=2 Tax=Porospora cf. gigantea A TaxID=2853593 RepID=UPI00355AC573|nr:MAG: hypothetical protein KVP18_004379 [Porospora cf. gigantea A]